MEFNRLKWASRRGMLELDLILLPFLENHYESLAVADQERYQKLMTCEDTDMFAWFLNRVEPTDPDLQKIVRIIRENTGKQS